MFMTMPELIMVAARLKEVLFFDQPQDLLANVREHYYRPFPLEYGAAKGPMYVSTVSSARYKNKGQMAAASTLAIS
jgi:hypothetical protein